jgi:hypothetical protein
VHLQVVVVLLERLDAGLAHLVLDAAHQAGPLVAGEIEGAALLQVVQQPLERRVDRLGRTT